MTDDSHAPLQAAVGSELPTMGGGRVLASIRVFTDFFSLSFFSVSFLRYSVFSMALVCFSGLLGFRLVPGERVVGVYFWYRAGSGDVMESGMCRDLDALVSRFLVVSFGFSLKMIFRAGVDSRAVFLGRDTARWFAVLGTFLDRDLSPSFSGKY